MDLFTSALFANVPRPAPFAEPSAPLPPLPPVAGVEAQAPAADEEEATLDALFPWMFPRQQEAPRARAQPPPYRPPA